MGKMSYIFPTYYQYIAEVIYMFLPYFCSGFHVQRHSEVRGCHTETGLVHDNIYPNVERNSGLIMIITKTLIKTENRPQKVAENFKAQTKAD